MWKELLLLVVVPLGASLIGACVGAYIGAELGFHNALKVEQITQDNNRKAREVPLLMTLKETLKYNKDNLTDLKKSVDPFKSPADVSILESTAFLKYEILVDEDGLKLCASLDHILYRLNHINYLIRVYEETSRPVVVPNILGGPVRTGDERVRINDIRSFVDETIKEYIEPAIRKIGNRRGN